MRKTLLAILGSVMIGLSPGCDSKASLERQQIVKQREEQKNKQKEKYSYFRKLLNESAPADGGIRHLIHGGVWDDTVGAFYLSRNGDIVEAYLTKDNKVHKELLITGIRNPEIQAGSGTPGTFKIYGGDFDVQIVHDSRAYKIPKENK